MSEENNVIESVEISEQMIQDFVKEIIKIEQDNLYVNRANLKEKIVAIAKTKVR
jgi:hypothetical protein